MKYFKDNKSSQDKSKVWKKKVYFLINYSQTYTSTKEKKKHELHDGWKLLQRVQTFPPVGLKQQVF